MYAGEDFGNFPSRFRSAGGLGAAESLHLQVDPGPRLLLAGSKRDTTARCRLAANAEFRKWKILDKVLSKVTLIGPISNAHERRVNC